jgi:hypothetical protein
MLAPEELLNRAVGLHDPETGLEGVCELRRHLDRLEAIHVENALRSGWRWSDVARSLGLSKQAAHRKYAVAMRERLARVGENGQVNGEGRIVVSGTARLAVLLGRQEAEALRRGGVGTEHLLLGLTRVEGTPVAETLGALGATPDAVRGAAVALEAEPVSEPSNGHLALTSPCRAALHRALQEAVELGDEHLGCEHLLLALLRDPAGGARRALDQVGVAPDAIAARVRERRGC